MFRTIRFLLDTLSNFVFGWVYFLKTAKIKPVHNPILFESAVSLAKKIRKQELTSVDVVKAYISRIKEVQPIINAIAEDRFEKALEDARKADQLITSHDYSEEELEKRFPLLGVPVTIKETFAIKGMLNTAGLVYLKNSRAEENADAVILMKKAGSIPLATTNTPELCAAWETNNYNYGRTCNAYDIKRIAGGSSGGEGAILGAGGSVIGIGSDLAGSIRMPAFFNGVFGHKPSKLIISNKGQLPKSSEKYNDFLTTGPMCRYAEDLLPILKILAGSNLSKLQLDQKVDISQLNIYYMEDNGGNPLATPVCSELKMAQRKVVNYFEAAYDIKPKKINLKKMRYSINIFVNSLKSIGSFSLVSDIQQSGKFNAKLELVKMFLGIADFTLPLLVYLIYEPVLNKYTSDQKYIKMAEELKQEMGDLLGNNGIFLYPSHPETAIYHNETLLKQTNIGYTAIMNALGFPATQCPLGLSSKGLPLGVQIVANLGYDHLTLSVAVELEKAFGGWRNPNI